MSGDATAKRVILENYLDSLRSEGYEVIAAPDKLRIPAFLEGFQPDALAFGPGKSLIVEVADPKSDKIKRIMKLIPSDWELRIVGVMSETRPTTLEVLSVQGIAAANSDVVQLTQYGQLSAALVLAWASFEASARALIPDQFQRPQTPGRLVEVLANQGIVTPDEADKLRALADKRNKLVHGVLNTPVTKQQVEEFLVLLQALERQLKERAN